MNKVIAIINDPEVTLGHLETRNIILLNAWRLIGATPRQNMLYPLRWSYGTYDT